jgi:broad-specificity NMP kinase
MGKYLITGRGGTGKSTICLELLRRGCQAFDADKVPHLCRWEDRLTGEPIDVDPAGYIDFKKVAWAWQDKVLRKLLAQHDNIFLCGSSSNQSSYYQLFQEVFVLTLDKETHDYRLRTRDFDYGKHPDLRRELVERHQEFARKLIRRGAIPININQPVENAAADILTAITMISEHIQ